MANLDILALNRPKSCEKCKGGLEYLGLGRYKCKDCGNEMLDNYGKIQKYYQEHGQVPVFQVARDTGISREDIHIILDGNESRRWDRIDQADDNRSFLSSRDKMRFLK